MLPLWNFHAYVSATGRPKFQEWYDALTIPAQAALDANLAFLIQRPQHEWGRPQFAMLSGKHAGIGELRFTVEKIVFRPFGFFGPTAASFTLLVGASKKGQIYSPRQARDTAVKRMNEIQSGRSTVHDWVL